MFFRSSTTIAVICCASQAPAQIDASQLDPPVKQTDSRGVDLIGGQARISIPLVEFGRDASALSASFELSVPPVSIGGPSTDFVRIAGGTLGPSLQPRAEESGAYYVDELGSFTNAVFPSGSGYYLAHSMHNIANPDGTQYSTSIGPRHMMRFISTDPNRAGVYNSAGDRGVEAPPIPPGGGYNPVTGYFSRIDFANGEQWTFNREYAPVSDIIPGQTVSIARLRSVVSSRGYAIQFLYMTDVQPTTRANSGNWYAPRKITAYNKAAVYCNESLLLECPTVSALPSTDIIYNSVAGTATVRRPGSSDGIELTFGKLGSNWLPSITSVRHTAVSNSTVTYLLGNDNVGGSYVQRVTDSDGQWNYFREVNFDDSGYVPDMHATATNPSGGVIEVVGHALFGQLMILTDELPRSHWVSVSARPGNYRVYGWMNPQFDSVVLDRDVRNNITEAVRDPIPGSGLPPITFYRATHPTDCMNPRTCNRPTSTTDALANITDYTYAPEHGGVLSETAPAPTAGAPRPQTRHTYVQRHAWISNGSGGYVQAATPIWVRTTTSLCRTSTATGNLAAPCATAGDEVLTQYDYGPNSGPNNLLLRGQTVTSTDGGATTTLRTCYGHDSLGRRISETQPNANLGSCP